MELTTDHDTLEELSLTELVEREQAWLALAARSYQQATFERLVDYSMDRIGKAVSSRTGGTVAVSAIMVPTTTGTRVVFELNFSRQRGVAKAFRTVQRPVVNA